MVPQCFQLNPKLLQSTARPSLIMFPGSKGLGVTRLFADTLGHLDLLTARTPSTLIRSQGPLRSPFIHTAFPSLSATVQPQGPQAPPLITRRWEVLCAAPLLKGPGPGPVAVTGSLSPRRGRTESTGSWGPSRDSHLGRARPADLAAGSAPAAPTCNQPYPWSTLPGRKRSSRCQQMNRIEKVISNSFLWPSYP